MQADPREGCGSTPTCARPLPEHPVVQHRRRQRRHRLRDPRTGAREAALEVRQGAARRAPTSSACVDADVTLKLDKPELRVEIDRARAADLGIRTADIAAALRLMVGGDEEVTRFRDRAANEDYDVQLRLDEQYRGDIATIERLYVPRSQRRPRAPRQRRHVVSEQSPSRVDRLDRQRQISLRGGIADGLRAGRSHRGAARRRRPELGMPPAYTVERGRPRPRARAHVRRVRMGVPALGHLHVHGARLAVREPGAPARSSCCRCRCRCRSRCSRSG